MTKAQAAALFLVGAAAGVGGMKLTVASPAEPRRYVHALDIRAGELIADGGRPFRRSAYGTQVLVDGGTKDIGQAVKCRDNGAAAQAAMRAMMDLAATDCEWP